MIVQLSTALSNAIIGGPGFRDALTGMELRLYGGTMPANADASIGSAVLLAKITAGGTGGALQFEASPVNGVLSKSSAQVWQGDGLAGGTATFCRLCLPADTDGLSTTSARLQGDAGVAGCFINLSSVTVSVGAPQRVGAFSIAQPKQ